MRSRLRDGAGVKRALLARGVRFMQRKYDDYLFSATLSKSDTQLHDVIKARKKKLPHSEQDANLPKFKFFHYLKFEKNADFEVRGQEFFRLMYPAQPKTRLIKHHQELVVASKEVPGCRSFSAWGKAQLFDDIKSGAVSGFGKIILLSLITQEADLKEANLMINNNRELIKLDGGCCFWNQQRPNHSSRQYFSVKDYRELPFIQDFQPFNWLDLIEYNAKTEIVKRNKPTWLQDEMKQWGTIRSEIHEISLGFLIMPDEFLIDFDKAYPGCNGDIVAKRLIESRKTLKQAAMDDPEFIRYLLSEKATKDVERYIAQFEAFCPKGKKTLPIHRYKNQFLLNAQTLKDQAQSRPQTRHWSLLRKWSQAFGREEASVKSPKPS